MTAVPTMRCVPIRARYDSYACWYDERLLSFVERARPLLTAWLGPGPGRCLELGCGGGVHLPPLTAAGWFVVGLDLSADQLGIARRRRQIKGLVRGDIACLPFADGSFDAAFAAFIQTDVDDWSGTAAEAARVVRRGGRLVCIGIHPCFVGPFSRYTGVAPPQLFPGYRRTERTHIGPGLGDGIARRVGVRHVPLAALFNALLESGLQVERVEEPGPEDYPRILAIKALRQ